MRTAIDTILSTYLEWAEETTGSVQFDGYYGLVRVESDEEQFEILAEADEDSDGVELLEDGWYIVSETPLGFFEYTAYDSEDEAESAFCEHSNRYAKVSDI